MKRPGSVALKVLGVVALSLLLSSCLKVNMDLTVSSDNKVSGTVIFAVDKKLLQATGQTADQLLSGNPIASPSAQGVTTEPYEDDTFIGQKVTFDSAPLSEFGTSGSDTLQIIREGEQFKVSGVMDLSNTSSGTGDPQMDQLVQQAMQTADIQISITFPGEVVSTNGKVDGNTVTWEPKIGERTEITAVASAKGSSSSTLLYILIGVGVLVVLAVGAFAMSRRGKKGGEVTPAAATGTVDATPTAVEAAAAPADTAPAPVETAAAPVDTIPAATEAPPAMPPAPEEPATEPPPPPPSPA